MTIHDGVKTYRGSCHCGAVRFEVDLDLSKGTSQCNCSICWKRGNWGAQVRPSAFRLLAGQDNLVSFRPKKEGATEHCRTCGLAPFGHGDIAQTGGAYVGINVRCLDGVDLSGVPIRYLDGRHDTWATLATARYADPFVNAGHPDNQPAWMST